MSNAGPDLREWLEVDGLGGFASGTVSGLRTRRYHALLLTATTPPTGRFVLVNGLETWIETTAGRFAISAQRYGPNVLHPAGYERIESFTTDPWPRWLFRLEDGTRIEQEIFSTPGTPQVVIRWRLIDVDRNAKLCVRPLFSGRDYHSLHHENPAFRFEPGRRDGQLLWRPYEGVPGTAIQTNGEYRHDPIWYRNFLYIEEQVCGLDAAEDLASPGEFCWGLSESEAVLILQAVPSTSNTSTIAGPLVPDAERLAQCEIARRRSFPTGLHRAADDYIVRRGRGRTIVAGYPWFTDWGRDTLISLRGLCLATGRLDDARDILLAWAETVSEGMLPNRFPDHGDAPEFNSVDASLWYAIAVHDYFAALKRRGDIPAPETRMRLRQAVQAILEGYARGTRFGIQLGDDGLLAAGQPGVQLTWMDVKIGDWVVTPRIGKPVEVQALWLNALAIASEWLPEWRSHFKRGRAAFAARFWDDENGRLYDVVDVDHQTGAVDASFRPNQIFAVGGLPLSLLDDRRARRVVDAVENSLWTPLGLRTLAPDSPQYAPRYAGDVRQRDTAYHQGTVWPWLLGAFVEAWVRVRKNSTKAKREAKARFLAPIKMHLADAGLGHVSEIADAESPHTPRGCPFQAWSLGELIRLEEIVLNESISTEGQDRERRVTRKTCVPAP